MRVGTKRKHELNHQPHSNSRGQLINGNISLSLSYVENPKPTVGSVINGCTKFSKSYVEPIILHNTTSSSPSSFVKRLDNTECNESCATNK